LKLPHSTSMTRRRRSRSGSPGRDGKTQRGKQEGREGDKSPFSPASLSDAIIPRRRGTSQRNRGKERGEDKMNLSRSTTPFLLVRRVLPPFSSLILPFQERREVGSKRRLLQCSRGKEGRQNSAQHGKSKGRRQPARPAQGGGARKKEQRRG